MTREETLSLMQRHTDAWNDHDADALLKLMTEDCIYDASAGALPHGAPSPGSPCAAPCFSGDLDERSDARWDNATHGLDGDAGFTTWTFRGTKADGGKIEVQGLDLLRFRGDKICHKDTYRKNVLA